MNIGTILDLRAANKTEPMCFTLSRVFPTQVKSNWTFAVSSSMLNLHFDVPSTDSGCGPGTLWFYFEMTVDMYFNVIY